MYSISIRQNRTWIQIAILLLAALLCLLPAVPASAAETEQDTPVISLSMGNPGDKAGTVPDSMVTIVSGGELTGDLPPGAAYDSEKAILSLDNFKEGSSRLTVAFDAPSKDGFFTINLTGDNSLLDIVIRSPEERNWLKITGDGSLTVGSILCDHFVMESGTLNIVQEADYFNYKDCSNKFALYNYNYGDKTESSQLSSFRFLGGEVNVDCSSDLGERRTGINVQSGNVEIRNSKVSIDLGNNKWLGLGVGWTGKQKNGGDLTIENGTLEVTGCDYQTYFYQLLNEGNPLSIFVGDNGPEKEVSFKEAFSEQSFTDDITRYARYSGKNGYLLLTSRAQDLPAFLDVPVNAYYSDAVNWAVSNNITQGTGDRQFSPNQTCTRKQVVTFLWRASGSPEPAGSSTKFTDIKSSDYFYKAVLWAVENGITSGMSETVFGPDEPCSRGQVATFLYRSQNSPSTEGSVNSFDDVSADAFYYNAVLWAVKNNITQGTGDRQFSPNLTCTRAQIVTFLYRTFK